MKTANIPAAKLKNATARYYQVILREPAISQLLASRPATSWKGLSKVNASRKAAANAKALAYYSLVLIRIGALAQARRALDKSKAEWQAHKTLARIC